MSENKGIIKKILDFARQLNSLNSPIKEIEFTSNPEANKLIIENPDAFLFAVLFDEGQRAERAWEFPHLLSKRIGHLDVKRIAQMRLIELVKKFQEKPSLRMPTKSACFLMFACQKLEDDYNSHARIIWEDIQNTKDIQSRLEGFYGIGQKKASMAVNILVRDLSAYPAYSNVSVTDKRGIDISFDRHVRRVFLRIGLIEQDNEDILIAKARDLNPDYPGELDLPCWDIGRRWCHPINPNCSECILLKECPRNQIGVINGF
jgi:endonuclease III